VLGICLEVLGTTLKPGVVDDVLNVSGTQNMSCPIQLFKAKERTWLHYEGTWENSQKY
jgi:hypothetical protein